MENLYSAPVTESFRINILGQPVDRNYFSEPTLFPQLLNSRADSLMDTPSLELPPLQESNFATPFSWAEVEKQETDILGTSSPIVNLEAATSFQPETLESGKFTVSSGGQFQIDFLADSGGYQGEIAIFSLDGMENLVQGSEEFRTEAARRALSNSNNGYIVISDATEGARFNGELGEINQNTGNYLGVKTFNFTPGTNFAFMLVPDGTVQQVLDNPALEGNQRPLFSLSSANPSQSVQFGQLLAGTINGGTFGFEDLRNDQNSDFDYNDLIFQIKGAEGSATLLTDLVRPEKAWFNTTFGQQIIDYSRQTDIFPPPSITANLANDTGSSNSDNVTNNPDIIGQVTDTDEIVKFQAKLNNGNFVDVLSQLNPDGSFSLDQATLTQINSGQLPDGSYQLTLKAEDEFGNVSSEVQLDFNLDTNAPQAANFISSVLASELQNPRGMTIDNEGNLYFTEAGIGGNGPSIVPGGGAEVFYGETGRISVYNQNTKTITPLITNLPSLATSTGDEGTGISDLAFNSAGDLYGVIGLGANPEVRTTDLGVSDFGQVIAINLSGTPSWTTLADIAAYEAANNPDAGDVDSNPYSLAIHNGTIFVTDAGGNDVVKVNGSTVSLETVLESRLVTAPPFIPSPTIPMEAVPTGIAIGADNLPYVGQLTGFPFPPGEANVYRIAEGDANTFAEGFSYITDIAFGADNSLYVLEYGKDFLGGDFQGSLWQVKADGTRSKIVSGGLLSPTGLAVDNQRIYIANRGNTAEGEILELLNLNNSQGNAQLSAGARLQGNVNGTGSTIDKLSYRFGDGSEINVPVNADGSFDGELILAGLSGEQNLIIKAVDVAGNSTEITQQVVVS